MLERDLQAWSAQLREDHDQSTASPNVAVHDDGGTRMLGDWLGLHARYWKLVGDVERRWLNLPRPTGDNTSPFMEAVAEGKS